MFTKLKQKKRAGKLYEGPAAYSVDYTLVPRPGFYALSEDGKNMLADVPLVMVDEAGGDPWNGSTHYEYAGPHDPPTRQIPTDERVDPPADAPKDIIVETHNRLGGKLVEFEVKAEGHSEVSP